MTAIVTQERAKTTWLTALAGLLLLAAAFALMVAAAPEHPHSRPSAVATTTSRTQAFLLTASDQQLQALTRPAPAPAKPSR